MMAKIIRAVSVKHGNAPLLGGLLHYVQAASNHTAKAYRNGTRGKPLYRAAVHHTHVYQARFADYIVVDVRGSHKAWRTKKTENPFARAPHYANPVAQTDYFEMAFDETSKRWSGAPAIHVAIYGKGRPGREWMPFEVPQYVVEQLTKPNRTPKTVRIACDRLHVVYEEAVKPREPKAWAGVDMNANNDTYALPDGTIARADNDRGRLYNAAHSRICRMRRRGDRRIMDKHVKKAWVKYANQAKDHDRKEARKLAESGIAVGYEQLTIHKLYTKDGKMAPYARGKLKTVLSTGQRRSAIVNAAEAEGLPHVGVDPRGTTSKCFWCGGKLKRSISWTRARRSMWCQTCHTVRERDCNAAVNILLRTTLCLIATAANENRAPQNVTLPRVLATLRATLRSPDIPRRDHSTLANITRLLEGRSAGSDWVPPGAHKPGGQNLVGVESMGKSGVGDSGPNGPGPPNVAKLCDYA